MRPDTTSSQARPRRPGDRVSEGGQGSLQPYCSAQKCWAQAWLRAGPEMGDDREEGYFRLRRWGRNNPVLGKFQPKRGGLRACRQRRGAGDASGSTLMSRQREEWVGSGCGAREVKLGRLLEVVSKNVHAC